MILALRVLSVRGIPIRIHISFAIVVGLLLWRTGVSLGIRAAVAQLVVVVLLLLCVVLHELGHAMVALRHDIPIRGITLYPFGGVAAFARRVPMGKAELQIAAAGPLVNLVLAAVVYVVTGGRALEPAGVPLYQIAWILVWANLLLAGFNLLPAFPLDGGRMLRGALAQRLGWVTATVWAASVGQIGGILLIGVGAFHNVWLALAGLLILPGANAELRRALGFRQLSRRRVADVMLTSLHTVKGSSTLTTIASQSREAPMADFLVQAPDSPTGFLPAPRLWSLVREPSSATRTAEEAAVALAPSLAPETGLRDALEHLQRSNAEAATVRGPNGVTVGVITRSGLERALSMATALEARESREHDAE